LRHCDIAFRPAPDRAVAASRSAAGAAGAALIPTFPDIFKRVKELIDQNLPWLNWLGGGDSTKTVSDLVSQVATWL
jgi:hypothetical protein